MNTTNLVILTGNLGKDPEVRYFDNGRGVASFSLATSKSYKDKEGKKVTETEWTKCSVFQGFETIEKYAKKGSQLQVIGSLKTRSWDDKEGNKKYSLEVVVDSFTLMGGNKEENNKGDSAPPQADNTDNPEDESGLPF